MTSLPVHEALFPFDEARFQRVRGHEERLRERLVAAFVAKVEAKQALAGAAETLGLDTP